MTTPLILIDWYRTLSLTRFWHGYEPTTLTAIESCAFANPARTDEWMRGRLSSEDICQEIERAGLGRADEHLEALKRSCEDFLPAPEVTAALKQLAERADVVLVSDNMDCFARWTVPTLKPLGIFKELIVSSDVGLLKNDEGGRIFTEICSRHGTAPRNVVFIDDSASTRQTFEKLGGRALPTNSPEDTVKVIQSLLENL